MHDFKLIAVLDPHFPEQRPRDDLPIALDRDLRRIEPKAPDHLCNAHASGNAPSLPIDPDSNRLVDVHRVLPIGAWRVDGKAIA